MLVRLVVIVLALAAVTTLACNDDCSTRAS